MSEPNPYASPQSGITEPGLIAAIEVPERITAPIRHGWIAATVSAAITLIASLIALMGISSNPIFNAWGLIDVALIAAMAFGIHRKSRIAATLMLGYFLLSKIIIMVKTGMPSGSVLGLVFLIFYFRAMVATFRYHRFVQHVRRFPPAPKKRISDDPYFSSQQPEQEG